MKHPEYEIAHFDDCICERCEMLRAKEKASRDLAIVRTFLDRVNFRFQSEPSLYIELVADELAALEKDAQYECNESATLSSH
jgi:hypothetical protein